MGLTTSLEMVVLRMREVDGGSVESASAWGWGCPRRG